jgi:glucose-6-phosphate 1-dehydrogenase
LVHGDSIILGISRRQMSAEALLADVELCVNETDRVCDPATLGKVRSALRMHQMSLTDGQEYDDLLEVVNGIEEEKGTCMDRLYYLSIPPQMFEPIVRNLGEHGHNSTCQHGQAAARLLIEKPFGYDVTSARELIAETEEWFTEEQTFRVDHYVAKNAVVDLLQFRLSHPEVSNFWNRDHIKKVEITASEQLDIEGRTIFYDSIGALRDVIQSHLLQVMAIAMMEVPLSEQADHIHPARLALLKSTRAVAASRGQYTGYRDEIGRDDTVTETYAELEVEIQTDAWRGVPVTLRTGKALDRKLTEIRFDFGAAGELVCKIQPDEGLVFTATGDEADALGKALDYYNGSDNRPERYVDAYERVFVEAAAGDHTLFTTAEEVMAAWYVVDAIVREWSQSDKGLILYPKGSAEVKQ